MLSQMRKHAGSWMIKVLLFAIVVVFSFWGVGSFRSRQDTRVAEVNGEKISLDQYRQTYNNMVEQYRRVYGNQLNDQMLKILNLRQEALDQMINRILLLQEAQRLKIGVSDEELTETVRQYPAFQANGVFDKDRYIRLLNQIRITPEEFERDQMQSLRMQKVQAMVEDGVILSEDEAREWYEWYYAEVDVNYVLFSPQGYPDVSADDGAIKAYFESHQDDYKTDPSVKVRYLFFDPQRYQTAIQINDDQIAQYYESHREEFTTEKTVEARHILLKVDENADEKTVAAKKERALEIYQMAKGGQDFAELAKKYSEGPTRDRGGYLGAFTRETMVEPFAERAFSMKAGEISEPVRTQFGWHIIKVEKINEGATKSLDAVKETIRTKLVSEQARVKALELAEKVYDNVFDGDNLADAGQTYDVPVTTSDYFTQKNPPLKGISNPKPFIDAAFGLEIDGISQVLDMSNGYYLLQVIDRKEAAIPAFETVADRVKRDVIKHLQNDRAQKDAQAMLVAVQGGAKFDEAAKQLSVEVASTGFFNRSGSIPEIGYDQAITEQAFLLSSAKPTCEKVLSSAKGWYLIQLKERKKPSEEGFEKDKATIISQLTQQKKQSVYQQWLADLKSRSTIDINQKLIE